MATSTKKSSSLQLTYIIIIITPPSINIPSITGW